MKHILTLSLSLSIAFATQAQLAPQTAAPLYRHMLEVNAQWTKVDAALPTDAQPVHFNNEAERISQHLHLVAGYLRTHSPEGLSAEAATKRTTLLSDLDRYADRGIFPQNYVLPYRNPVFIDPVGTACAVGQLMIESGHRDLAESISMEMNLAYVHDMKRADVLQWATQEGFTEDELAWIQPGYPPTLNWSPLNGGTNGPVNVLLLLPDNSVLVAGAFTEAGGIPAQNVAIVQGWGFVALGAGVEGTITCAAANGNDIYLGGYNLNGINDLAHWDGTQWEFSTVFQGKMPMIFALHVMNDTLYAAGETQGFAGADEYVMRSTGPLWEVVPGDFDAPIRCLGTHNGRLVAGGSFTTMNVNGSTLPALHIASLDPAGWSQLGDGLDGNVLALLNKEGTLYAGGAMYDGTVAKFGFASIAPASSTWELLMPNLSDYTSSVTVDPQVRALQSDGDNVYVGGNFEMFQMIISGKHLVKFLGTPDSFEALAFFNAPVNALASNPFVSDAYGLYAAGEFTQNVGSSVPYLAEAILTTGMQEASQHAAIALHPNPATDRLTITLEDGASANTTIQLLDVQGRTILTRAMHGESSTLDITTLAPGAYTVRIVGEQGIRSQTFIKH